MRIPPECRAGRHRRSAFTLMETMVALALLGMIMMSVGTSLTLYWKYRTLSRDRVISAQILRGLLDDLTSDLRSVSASNAISSGNHMEIPENVQAALATGAAPAGLERTLRVQEQQLNLGSMQDSPIALVGTSQSLSILTEHDNPRFDATSEGPSTFPERHVVWWMNSGSPVRISLSHAGPQISSTTVTAGDQPHGLVRLVQPFPQDSSLKTRPVLVSRHVSSIAFRYYDGSQWVTDWNSWQRSGLPAAVEVTLTMKSPDNGSDTFVIEIPQS
jgi:prepilin-type N-terminal cleavage/methylation domain-containing protein